MYSITEILIIQLLCFMTVFYLKIDVHYLNRTFPFFNVHFDKKINEFINFVKFIHNNNPLLLNYADDVSPESTNINIEDNKKEDVNVKPETKYEDKYLEKFKHFPNEFILTETELEEISEEYSNFCVQYEKDKFCTIHTIQEQLSKINEIQEKGNINEKNSVFTENINKFGINCILKYYDIETENYDDEQYEYDIEELYIDLLKDKEELLKKMEETEKIVMNEEDMRKKARDVIINKKLDKYINNYVLECTPLGNIYMRYNNDKKSFEYFSNNSIPYRYLEPVGRKYVTTYWCKPIFVDIEEELKRAEEKFDEEKKKKEAEEKRVEEERKKNPKKFLAQLKNYNKETKDVTMRPMKNRTDKNSVLPPQVKSNLPDVNKSSEKQLLKENANRYTWEGRLTNFCPLKKIDRKILDKKLTMTYAEFKKIQQEQQNKK